MVTGKKIEVVLQEQSKSSDGMGGKTVIWTDVITFKGVMSPNQRRSEILKYTKDVSAMPYTLVANTPSVTITTNHRIYYQGRIFNITAVSTPLMLTKLMVLDLLEVK